ncbi:hypothetical protein SAMN05192529_12251 [Arachidicoccus rhizosphaerae]|jgi:hypothetical protein|uniref:PIN domain-containing protein n=1 Tax=Arachidicoccus rhizosphaerae TaxID=551991 RepID=A0A1H4BLA9_9BACT|nr:hypothetical protein SAMN05192529_12251 [Arachidicoccus rhizosphaerae]
MASKVFIDANVLLEFILKRLKQTAQIISGTVCAETLELDEISKKWTTPIRNWGIVLNQFLIIFVDRLKV